MASESDEYPVSDGELSFSRWRSNTTSLPLKKPQAAAEESALDFQSQFARRSENGEGPTDNLSDRRGISLTIPPYTWDQIGNDSTLVSDQEFERDFGFESRADPKARMVDRRQLARISSGLHSLQLVEEKVPPSLEEERGSRGSSELSLQDLVERQEENFISTRGSVHVALLRTMAFILIWYFFSTGLTIYNKELLGAKLWDFPAPLLMNTVHFALQAIISSLALRFLCPSMRPTTSMSWKDYFIRVVPTAVATALDIDLTNASLVFISISFETMCKSAAPVFLLLFAFAFKLEAPSFKLFGIISIISSGVLLTGLGSLLSTKSEEKRFEVLGFILVLFAAIMSGFRWTVTQILLQKKEFGLNNPLAVMCHLAPVMAIITAVLSLASEPLNKLAEHPFFDTYLNAMKSSLLLLLGGSLAFFMVLAEYLLISKTSAVTLTVAGVVKEVVTIVVAVVFLHDGFSALKGVGLAIIMIGVVWFNWFKYQRFRESKHMDHVESERIPVRYVPLTDKSKDSEETHSF